MKRLFTFAMGLETKSKVDQARKRPNSQRLQKNVKTSEDPESYLRQTAGDREQKLIKCEDSESHLRQTAGDQEQKLTRFRQI